MLVLLGTPWTLNYHKTMWWITSPRVFVSGARSLSRCRLEYIVPHVALLNIFGCFWLLPCDNICPVLSFCISAMLLCLSFPPLSFSCYSAKETWFPILPNTSQTIYNQTEASTICAPQQITETSYTRSRTCTHHKYYYYWPFFINRQWSSNFHRN